LYNNPYLQPYHLSLANAPLGNCFSCLQPNNFSLEIFPKLLEVKQREIEVICIGGDLGFQTGEFEYRSPEGIQFLASGINGDPAQDKALLFCHDIAKGSLVWEYKLVSEL